MNIGVLFEELDDGLVLGVFIFFSHQLRVKRVEVVKMVDQLVVLHQLIDHPGVLLVSVVFFIRVLRFLSFFKRFRHLFHLGLRSLLLVSV